MFDPLALKRPKEAVETRTFTDPSQPDISLELTMASFKDYTLKIKAEELSTAHASEHIGKFAVMFDGEQVPITQTFCGVVAMLQTMVRTPEVAAWTFEQWAALAVGMPEAFEDIVDWATELMNAKRESDPADGPSVPNGSTEASALQPELP